MLPLTPFLRCPFAPVYSSRSKGNISLCGPRAYILLELALRKGLPLTLNSAWTDIFAVEHHFTVYLSIPPNTLAIKNINFLLHIAEYIITETLRKHTAFRCVASPWVSHTAKRCIGARVSQSPYTLVMWLTIAALIFNCDFWVLSTWTIIVSTLVFAL